MSSLIGKLIRWIGDTFSKGDATMFKGINLWSKGLSKSPQKFEHYQEPITRQSYCTSGHLAGGVSSYHSDYETTRYSASGIGRAPCAVARNNLLIGLPPSSKDQKTPNVMEECVKKDTTAKELIGELASKLRVNKDKWVLIAVSDEKTPYVLKMGDKLEKFINSKTERLYFYPEFVVRR